MVGYLPTMIVSPPEIIHLSYTDIEISPEELCLCLPKGQLDVVVRRSRRKGVCH